MVEGESINYRSHKQEEKRGREVTNTVLEEEDRAQSKEMTTIAKRKGNSGGNLTFKDSFGLLQCESQYTLLHSLMKTSLKICSTHEGFRSQIYVHVCLFMCFPLGVFGRQGII